jgi:hypothetical protein
MDEWKHGCLFGYYPPLEKKWLGARIKTEIHALIYIVAWTG